MDFRKLIDIIEGASGYIAKNSKEAKDPRFSMGMTQDIKPGEIERQAKKFGNEFPPPLLHSKAAKNSTPNKLMNLGLNESMMLESRGLFARKAGDKFQDAEGKDYTFQGISTYPRIGKFDDANTLQSEIQKVNATIPEITWINKPSSTNLSFGLAKFDSEAGSKVFGKFFQKIEEPGSMLGKWQNNEVPGLNYRSSAAKKEQSGLKPQLLLKGRNRFESGSEMLGYLTSLPDLSDTIKQGLSMIGQGQLPVFEGEAENLTSIRDNLGELIQVLCLTHNLIEDDDVEKARNEVLLGADLSTCAIEFPDSQISGLTDSKLLKNGAELGISSKGNKGANASIRNLTQALDRVPEFRLTIEQRYPLTVEVLDMVNDNNAIQGPLKLAVKLKLINPAQATEVVDLIKRKETNEAQLSGWAKSQLDYYKGRQTVGWNYGNWILASVAKQVGEKINQDKSFSDGCIAILNNSGMIQLYTDAVTKGNDVVVSEFRAVYPPEFSGRLFIDHGKNYFASGQKGKLVFGFSKPKDEESDDAIAAPARTKRKPVDISATNPKLKTAPKGVGREKRK